MQDVRMMGLDYGKARIGVAFSTFGIANADHIYKTKSEEQDIAYLSNIIAQKNISVVVFGLPLNADGTESEMSACVRDFASKLQKATNVVVEFQDERYTSFEADEILKEAGLGWQKRKELLDKISAQIILQNHIDAKK